MAKLANSFAGWIMDSSSFFSCTFVREVPIKHDT